MDEIIEPFLRAIWAVIRFMLWAFLFYTIMFNIGRAFLLIATLGKYPRLKHIENDTEKIGIFGLFLVILAWVALAIFNNANT